MANPNCKGKEAAGLSIQSFWKVETPGWTDYYMIASGHVIQIHPLELPERSSLPPGAQLLDIRDERFPVTDLSLPTGSILGAIAFIGTDYGDDVNIVLSNGSVILYYLESNPEAIYSGQPELFESIPRILFLEPRDQVSWDVSHQPDNYTSLLSVRWLQDGSTSL